MTFAIINDEQPVALGADDWVEHDGVRHPVANLARYSAEERARIGVHGVEDSPIPDGHIVIGDPQLVLRNGNVVRVFETRPAPPAAVPAETALFRARAVMKMTPFGAGTLFEAVAAAIPQIPDPTVRAIAQEAFEYSNVVSRHGAVVGLIKETLGLSDELVDQLFLQAEAIPA